MVNELDAAPIHPVGCNCGAHTFAAPAVMHPTADELAWQLAKDEAAAARNRAGYARRTAGTKRCAHCGNGFVANQPLCGKCTEQKAANEAANANTCRMCGSSLTTQNAAGAFLCTSADCPVAFPVAALCSRIAAAVAK